MLLQWINIPLRVQNLFVLQHLSCPHARRDPIFISMPEESWFILVKSMGIKRGAPDKRNATNHENEKRVMHTGRTCITFRITPWICVYLLQKTRMSGMPQRGAFREVFQGTWLRVQPGKECVGFNLAGMMRWMQIQRFYWLQPPVRMGGLFRLEFLNSDVKSR